MVKISLQTHEQISLKISWGHWFAFFNIIIVLIIATRYGFIIQWPDTLLGKVYFVINTLGHFSFIIFCGYLLFIFPLSFIFKNERTFRGLVVIITTILINMLLFDTEVFAQFKFHLSSMIWDLLINPENGELSRLWQLFFVPMPLILLIEMLFSYWAWEKIRVLNRQHWKKYVIAFFSLMFVSSHLLFAVADAMVYRPITEQSSYLPLSSPMTAHQFLQKNMMFDMEKYNEAIVQSGRLDAPNIYYPRKDITYTKPNDLKNILLINISGLSYEHITENGSPHLYELTTQANYFTNNYSASNQNNANLMSLFYGLDANYFDSILKQQKTPVLFDALTKHQYTIALFTNQRLNSPLYNQKAFNQYIIDKSVPNDNHAVIESWSQWYAKHDSSDHTAWFSYLDLDLVKTNIIVPDKNNQNNMLWLDQNIHNIIQRITNRNELNNTIIIITSNGSSNTITNKDFAPLSQTKAPLIIYWPQNNNGTYTNLTSNIDLIATLMLHIFGASNNHLDYTQGHDLFAASKREWVLLSNSNWKVIITLNGHHSHINRHGDYIEYDAQHNILHSRRPNLGLLLYVIQQNRLYTTKPDYIQK